MKQIVDVIMLNYNGVDFTPKCVETLYKNTEYPFNLVVVDNCSTDGSEEYLRKLQEERKNVTVHFSEVLDSGFAEGNNIGLKYSYAPYVLIFNNDIIISQKGWLTELVGCLEKEPNRGIVSPKLLYPNGRIQYAGATFNGRLEPFHIGRYKRGDEYNVEREIPTATFACVLIKKELLRGGLDEAYLIGTYEDVDFCCKTRKAGYTIWYCPSVTLYHYESAAQFSRPIEDFVAQQKANAQLFAERWNNWLREDMKRHPKVYRE